jgi:regulator of sigma D
MEFDLLEHELKTRPDQIMSCEADRSCFCSPKCLIDFLLSKHFNVFLESLMEIKKKNGLEFKEDTNKIWGISEDEVCYQ